MMLPDGHKALLVAKVTANATFRPHVFLYYDLESPFKVLAGVSHTAQSFTWGSPGIYLVSKLYLVSETHEIHKQ